MTHQAPWRQPCGQPASMKRWRMQGMMRGMLAGLAAARSGANSSITSAAPSPVRKLQDLPDSASVHQSSEGTGVGSQGPEPGSARPGKTPFTAQARPVEDSALGSGLRLSSQDDLLQRGFPVAPAGRCVSPAAALVLAACRLPSCTVSPCTLRWWVRCGRTALLVHLCCKCVCESTAAQSCVLHACDCSAAGLHGQVPRMCASCMLLCLRHEGQPAAPAHTMSAHIVHAQPKP